jgi:hypothetical protein
MRKEFEFEGRRLFVDYVHTREEFFDFMGSLQLSKPFMVKPNWICGTMAISRIHKSSNGR